MDIAQWEAFCDALKRSGEQVLRPGVPADLLTRAEGYRYLTRLLRLALEKNIEFSDPGHPQFYSLSHETAKIGNDNPDNLYMNCAVSGRYDYRIRGQRGTVAYMSLESKAGSYGGSGDMAPTGHIELDTLELDAQGQFEIIVSSRPQAGNWLPMTLASDNLLVRQTFNDRKHETPARLEIGCLNPDGASVLDPLQFAQQLALVPRFVEGTAALFNSWMEIFKEHVNALPANDQAMCLQAGGDPSIHYHNSCWQLEPGQALLIEVSPPSCRTWNFQLSNHWMESLDYRYHRIHINKHSATYRDDGSVQILVAHEDPGEQFPNWLSTAGHTHGAMLFRYVEADTFPPIKTRVITLEDL